MTATAPCSPCLLFQAGQATKQMPPGRNHRSNNWTFYQGPLVVILLLSFLFSFFLFLFFFSPFAKIKSRQDLRVINLEPRACRCNACAALDASRCYVVFAGNQTEGRRKVSKLERRRLLCRWVRVARLFVLIDIQVVAYVKLARATRPAARE